MSHFNRLESRRSEAILQLDNARIRSYLDVLHEIVVDSVIAIEEIDTAA